MSPGENGTSRMRGRLLRIRRSRRVFHWIAGIAASAWLASIAIIVADELTSSSDDFSPFPDIHSSVAVATDREDSFGSVKSLQRGFFNICPQGDQDWKVVFSWSIVVPDADAALPPLYLIVPADASQINPEKQVLVDRDGGVTYTPTQLTQVRELRKTETHKILELKVGQLVRENNLAYLGINFHTSTIDAGHASLGERRFKFANDPRLARDLGFTPGFGGAQNRSEDGDKNLSVISCNMDQLDGKKFTTESLNPEPTKTIEQGKLLWETRSTEVSTVSGSTTGGWTHTVRTVADWTAINALAGALGAIYGVGIEPPMEAKEPAGSRPASTGSKSSPGSRAPKSGAPAQKRNKRKRK